MKKRTAEILVFSAFVLFGLVLLMTAIGAISCLFGAGESFYCGIYCTMGKVFMGAVALTIIVRSIYVFIVEK